MKKALLVVGILILVVLAAGVGMAWYYSGLIIDGATIKGATEDFSNTVTKIEPSGASGTITYTVPDTIKDPATNAYTVSITGLRFADGGYLQLQQGAQVEGSSITRPYMLLAGKAPKVGDQGQYDWDSYPDPKSMGLTSEPVTYQAPLGPTPAMVISPATKANGTWVVVAHGRNGSIREGLRAVPLYAERGLTTMLINYRDDRQESGVPYEDGIGNFGQTEWPDLQAAVQYAQGAGAKHVILVGWSMGGAIIASYLEHATDTSAVVATMLDSPAVSFADTVVHQAELKGIPTKPLAPVIWMAGEFTSMREDLNFTTVEYKDNAANWPVPALVTAASEDTTVDPQATVEFADALPADEGEFAMFDGASHTGEWNHDQDRYDELVGSWLDDVAIPAAQG